MWNLHAVRQHIENLKVVYPDLFTDEEAWELTLDSETDLDGALTYLLKREREAAAMAGAMATQIAELEARQSRFERRSKAARELMFKLMDSANVKKRELPLATVSIRNGGMRVAIDNEDAVPDAYCRIKREPNKTLIKAALESGDGDKFNWAALVQGEPSLSVRVK